MRLGVLTGLCSSAETPETEVVVLTGPTAQSQGLREFRAARVAVVFLSVVVAVIGSLSFDCAKLSLLQRHGHLPTVNLWGLGLFDISQESIDYFFYTQKNPLWKFPL
jgi:hypothetical protein